MLVSVNPKAAVGSSLIKQRGIHRNRLVFRPTAVPATERSYYRIPVKFQAKLVKYFLCIRAVVRQSIEPSLCGFIVAQKNVLCYGKGRCDEWILIIRSDPFLLAL